MNTLRCADLRFESKPDRLLECLRCGRGTILRGAFGSILKEIACDPLCSDHTTCEFGSECAYERPFAPMNRPDAARLSLNKDLPRSFVLIPDDNCPELVAAGAQFSFVARLFGEAVSMHPYVPRRRGGLKRDRSRSQFAKRSGPIASRTTVLTPLNRSAYRSD